MIVILRASKEFVKQLRNGNRKYYEYVDLALKDGTELHLTNKDLWNGGVTIEDATSSENSFDIGSVIINQATIVIENLDERFSTYDFDDAKVVVSIGLDLGDKIEKIQKGIFHVSDPKYNGSIITLECLDNITKLDEPYTKSELKYPATLKQIAEDACSCCGLNLRTKYFWNNDFLVENRPQDDALTFREVMLWIGQISCNYVKCDVYGDVYMLWYDEKLYTEKYVLTDHKETHILTNEKKEIVVFSPPAVEPNILNGGVFDKGNPYQSGDHVDGGLFNPWDVGYEYDSGKFKSMDGYHHIHNLFSISINTDDIKITGVAVEISTEKGEAKSFLFGETGYVPVISKNGFIQSEDSAKKVAQIVGEKVIGMSFRPFSVDHLSDPLIEAGDTVYITDRKQNTYRSYITNTSFGTGKSQSSSCGAESPAQKSVSRYTEATKVLLESKKNTSDQINTYDKAVQNMTSIMANSMGMFETIKETENGGRIVYQHNKPSLEESDKIWMKSENGFMVSSDGGKNWNSGWDVYGNAVMNVLSVVGIRFDWAKGGTLTLGGENNVSGQLIVLDEKGNRVCEMNKDGAIVKGQFISGDSEEGTHITIKPGGIVWTDENEDVERTFYTKTYEIVGEDDTIVQFRTPQTYYGPKVIQMSWSFRENSNATFYMKANGTFEVYNNKEKRSDSFPGKLNGRAEFSDGSYLEIKGGLVVGGKTASGLTFGDTN